jgi:hypothetical protein
MGLTDGPVDGLTIQVLSRDTLELNWGRQAGDSAYYVYWSVFPDSAWTRGPKVAANQAKIEVADTLRQQYFRIERILRP